ANLEMGSPAVLVPLILLTLSAGWLFLLSKKTLKFLPALGLVVFLYLDLFSFGHYLGREFLSFSEIQNPPASIRYLLSRPDLQDFRVYPTNRCAFVTLLYPDANMLYGLATVNGFEDVVLKDYAAATGFSFLGTNSRERQLLVENKLLSLLSVRYVITRDAELAGFLSSNRNSLDFPYVKVFQDNPTDLEAKLLLQNELRPQKIRKGEENTPFAIFENKSYLPRVRFVRTLIPVPDLSAATSILKRGTDFDWVNSAIVETKTELQHALAGGKILSSIYNSGFIQIHAKTEGNAFLILSDQYYPGWTALVDGKQTSIYRTNGLVRGVFVTAPGDHTIEFHFAPPFLLWGAVFSSLTLVFLFTSLILSSRTAKHEQAKPVGQKCGNPGHSGRALGAAGASHSLFRWLFLSHF
ncbi:MAG TPA: YfhO family protein, partial [Acidobacteriota bacterium]|nr:YfhO family protein [Acidobacteriota bacterium]